MVATCHILMLKSVEITMDYSTLFISHEGKTWSHVGAISDKKQSRFLFILWLSEVIIVSNTVLVKFFTGEMCM